ncbi:hypothetical protein [Sphingobium sp. CCH11-B1]|jgi:hypothetical protein|uniref:hypothetical protein n=1 Tax=Sphingobium sp. CCH11-B1 TaxID=1768781 RepID=UPI0018D25C7E|nr:hypothetical protein [Sphingobium sp. CCH11-B1]MEA3387844.1 hypothetical protein [Pseudomonadota bacterium]
MRDERKYVVDTIGSFLNGSSGKWDWDDFTSNSLRSAELNSIRLRAAALHLPLDADGEAALMALRDEAELLTDADIVKPRPWRMATGVVCGLLVGAALWWNNYIPGAGLFQNPQLLLIPAALGIAVVSLCNKRKKVGPYDPNLVALNRHGRV